jgi:hypothetical protein
VGNDLNSEDEAMAEPVSAPKTVVRNRRRRVGRAMLWAMFCIFMFIAAALAFGVTPADAKAIREFDSAVRTWQHDPDFRVVALEYAQLGSRAMQAKFCGIPARHVVMWFRQLPGLPDVLKIGPSSQPHYDDFSIGPLKAYMHLSKEQDVKLGIDLLKKLPPNPTDEELREFIRGFHLPVTIATDGGAVESVRRLLKDVQPDQPFTVDSDQLAEFMSRQSADDSLKAMDERIRMTDPQVWRNKQISDFLAGIWAQGYGQFYSAGIHTLLLVRIVARVMLLPLFVLAGWKLKRSIARVNSQ